ncbi:hypothetical protein [Bacillus paralicheniformis]|uniref:hypothetical protein n=1 Tax=Bacillus paralicheniformis TaxID=1648923 RepID=UPI001D04C4BE|nr:hypothetical protein [Bacillus paralicheniformis]
MIKKSIDSEMVDSDRSGGLEIDQNALRFYQIRRRLEDIWEFTEQLAFDIQTEKEKAETMSLLKKELKALKS